MISEPKIRAAVIGLGNIGFMFDLDPLRTGTWSHVRAYAGISHTFLAGVAELDMEKVALFRCHYPGVPAYGNVGELMERCRPEIVSICTPTATHYPVLKELLRYPVKGIFCEKPLSFHIDEAAAMVRMCEERGIVLAVNHTRRWDEQFLYVKKVVQGGGIGKVRTIGMIYPGRIFNIGTHLVDALRMIVGREPIRVSGLAAAPDQDDPDVSGWLQMDDHTVCTLGCVGRRENLVFELDFIGEEGRVRILDNGATIEKYLFRESSSFSGYRELTSETVETVAGRDRLVEAVRDVAVVAGGGKGPVKCTGRDGLSALRIVRALISSADQEGLPISLLPHEG